MRTIFCLLAFLCISAHIQAQQSTMKLIYVYDALCGWCYGFSSSITKLEAEYEQDFEVEVVSGGMVTGTRIGPIGEVAGYISQAYKDVEQRTGVQFGKGFLEGVLAEGSTLFTSVPPAVALSVFKELKPDQQLAFAARLQKAIYFDGIAPAENSAYAALAEEFGLNGAEFVQKMEEKNALEKAEADFSRSNKLGVSGFPTVIVQSGEEEYVIARGYLPYANLEVNYLRAKELLLRK